MAYFDINPGSYEGTKDKIGMINQKIKQREIQSQVKQ